MPIKMETIVSTVKIKVTKLRTLAHEILAAPSMFGIGLAPHVDTPHKTICWSDLERLD